MTQTTYWFPKNSLIVGVLVALVAMAAPGAQAAFTNNFDALLTELQSRSTALTGSTDKTDQKEKKAVDKAIAAINKPATSLATDVKTGVKVAKSLAKAFPGEFGAASVVFSNNIDTLLGDAFDGLNTDVTDQFTALQTTVNALPAGKAKTKATVSVVKAQAALDAANAATDFATIGKSLGSALKAIASGTKAANGGGGGGGGHCTSTSTLTATVSNENPQWNSTSAGASIQPSTSDFLLFGNRGDTTGIHDTIAIGLTGVTGQGDYTIVDTSVGGSTAYFFQIPGTNTDVYGIVTGTIHIATFNASAVGTPFGDCSGDFHFTAADPLSVTNTLDGSFDICGMVTLP